MKYTEDSHDATGCANNIHSPSNCGYDIGTVRTFHGLVEVYAQGDERHRNLTRLTVCIRGRLYSRQWMDRYSHRRIVTLAKRFAADMNRKHTQPPQHRETGFYDNCTHFPTRRTSCHQGATREA